MGQEDVSQTRLVKQLQTKHVKMPPCQSGHLSLAGCLRTSRALRWEREGRLGSRHSSECVWGPFIKNTGLWVAPV